MKDWFLWYVQQVEERKDWAMYRNRYLCPCCFMPTLNARAAYDVCKICDWEDDGQDSDDADIIRGGPIGHYVPAHYSYRSASMGLSRAALLAG